MVTWSMVAGAVGVLGSWLGMIYLARGESDHAPEVFWVLGLAALGPAWLIAVWGLLDRMAGRFPDPSMAAWWIISGAAGLAGVLVTDGVVRRLHESGRERPRTRYWFVGLAGSFPAWLIALAGLVWTASR